MTGATRACKNETEIERDRHLSRRAPPHLSPPRWSTRAAGAGADGDARENPSLTLNSYSNARRWARDRRPDGSAR